MIIDKAIELLNEELLHPPTICNPDLKASVKLGIEALRRVEDMRISPCTTPDEILPGETKD